MTLTFNLGGHGACRWCGSTSSIRTPTLKFLGLTVRKIWHLLCVCVSRPVTVTVTFDLLTLKLVRNAARVMGYPPANFGDTTIIRFRFMMSHWANTAETDHVTLWPWLLTLKVMRLRLMRVVVRLPNLKFVGLGIRKIWRTTCVSINAPGDPDLWPFDLETGMRMHLRWGTFISNLGTLYACAFSNYSLCTRRTDEQTDEQKQRVLPRAGDNKISDSCGRLANPNNV